MRGVRLLPLLLRLSTFKASLLYSPGSCAVSTVSRLIECFLALGSHELAYWSRKLNHLLDHGLISSSRWPNHIFNQVIKTKFTTWILVHDLAVQFAGLVTDLSSLALLAPDTANAWLEKLEVKNYSHLTPEICYSGEALRDCPGAIVYSGNLLVFCYWTSTCTTWLIFLGLSQSDSCLSSLADHSYSSLWTSLRPSTR